MGHVSLRKILQSPRVWGHDEQPAVRVLVHVTAESDTKRELGYHGQRIIPPEENFAEDGEGRKVQGDLSAGIFAEFQSNRAALSQHESFS